MGSTRLWLLLAAAQIVTLALLAAAGPVTAETPALRYVGYACLAGIFACVPPILVKLFVAGQRRIGQGDRPLVRALQQHQAVVIVSFWALIVAALAMAWPRIVADLREEEDLASAAIGAALPVATMPAAPVILSPVSMPPPGSPEHAGIVDALRQRFKPSGRFRVDQLRLTSGWAFVRATEVLTLPGGEQQETDLSVAALLERPAASTTGWWRIVDMWTLPDEPQRPFAEFARRVQARQRAEGLPDALFAGGLEAGSSAGR